MVGKAQWSSVMQRIYGTKIGCLSLIIGIIGVTTVAVEEVPTITSWVLPPPPTPTETVRLFAPTFGGPPAEFLDSRIPANDQSRLLALYYNLQAMQFFSNLDKRAYYSTGQFVLDLLPSRTEFVKPEFRVLDRRGFAAGARPEPVVRYPGGAASDGADYDALAAIAEMQYILRKYLAPELRGTSPEIRPTDSLNEARAGRQVSGRCSVRWCGL